jgi:hypothetical protein
MMQLFNELITSLSEFPPKTTNASMWLMLTAAEYCLASGIETIDVIVCQSEIIV